MVFAAFAVEKDGVYWSRVRSRWLADPCDGCLFESRQEAEAIAATAVFPGRQETFKVLNDGTKVVKPAVAAYAARVVEVSIQIKG